MASLDDSGFSSPSPKRARVEASLEVAAAPFVDRIEDAYSELYLTKDDSLLTSYKSVAPPPMLDSAQKMVKALAVSPQHTGGIRSQICRMIL